MQYRQTWQQHSNNRTEVADPAHNSRNSLDWAGVYKGTLPCADCEGIQEEIRLNDDLTYEMVSTYLGKGENGFQITAGSNGMKREAGSN
jgi:uncharacterized lipoprotein NlpE involved in copper resistance